MLYVPTVMLYFVGVSVYLLGPGHESLADNKLFALFTSLTLLALLTALNIAGLGVGKWINNVGAIGTGIAAALLINRKSTRLNSSHRCISYAVFCLKKKKKIYN